MATKKETRIIKTKRDREILDFLSKGMYATAEQLNLIFFNSPVSCRRRLVRMYEMGWIQRVRADESLPYVYFKKDKETSRLSYEEQQELKHSDETKQNKRLFLTQCLIQLAPLGGHFVKVEMNKTLTTSVVDLLVVYECYNQTFLFLLDVFNREGNGLRHQTFLNGSKLLQELTEEYKIDYVITFVYAPRFINPSQNVFYIARPASLSYRDYKQVNWLTDINKLKKVFQQLFT